MAQLQHELADALLPHAVSALWRVLTDPAEGGGIAQQIEQAVHGALAQQRDEELQRRGQAAARAGS
ncbi:3D-(3,5 4)-trihydroxycyclohexane-1,2-dione acylhydrolase (decyclizing) [Chlorella sorokiniana]|uniref:3D-(3,5 4)-trihydroxycyclohexane-1,2-dione acylhydrolase (Decyclizing) n=1 Tax=Chlorella sorokiniana TaxID=3076 RepID=A0A2P6U157_CHLSO|nr:3D-(3,5 4)-trihydroxycyclohexane-1,2-dione acylhydrolase (decyclizing) [Chlorella sorokiniana]|eukprot:PRW60038.1 3D-(3,5 4)-trihydroxycyclohexane-1,2-dione acylhydrolase (decyclizing) [Chlorella sorokiniana]